MGKILDREMLNFSIGLLAKSIDMTFIKKTTLFNVVQKETYREATSDDDSSIVLEVVSNDTNVLGANQIKSDTVRFTTPIKSIFSVGAKIVHIDEILEPKFDNIKNLTKEELDIYKNATIENRQLVFTTNVLLIVDNTSMILYDYELDIFKEISIGASAVNGGIKKWEPLTNYSEDDIVVNDKSIYISIDPHTSSDSFDNDRSHWENPLIPNDVKIKINDVEIEKDADGFIKITIPKNVSDLEDTEFTDLKTDDIIVWDGVRNKFINKAVGLSDEKIKLYASDVESKYLSELIGSSLNIVDGKIEAVLLKGMTVTIANLNTLAGMETNIKDILDGISGGMSFMGTVDTHAELLALENTKNGDVRIVKIDETKENVSFTYVYNETQKEWQPIGTCEIKVRDFTINPIDLTKEVTGKLPQTNMDMTDILKVTDIIDSITDTSVKKPASANSVSTINKALIELKESFDKGFKADDIIGGTNIEVKQNEDGSITISYKEEQGSSSNTKNIIYVYEDDLLPEKIESDYTCLVLTKSGKMYTTNEDGTLLEQPTINTLMTEDDYMDVINAIMNSNIITQNENAVVTKKTVTEIMKSLDTNCKTLIEQKAKKMPIESRDLIISKIKSIINKE